MARLSDLPFEIILMIYSMIPDRYSAREILEAVDWKRRDALLNPSTASIKEFDGLRERNITDRMALTNFKRCCRAYSRLPIRKHFGHVPIGIHAETPLEAMEQVCEMIELLLHYPDMALCVRQLYFYVEERYNEEMELELDLQDRLMSVATSSAVHMNLEFHLTSRNESIRDALQNPCDSDFFLGFGLVLLVRLLPNVEHLVLAAQHLAYNWVDRLFPAFGGPAKPSPLSLRSFVFQGDHPNQRRCLLLKLSAATGFFQNGSELVVQDTQMDFWRYIDTSKEVRFHNLSSLVLSNVDIRLGNLERVINGIPRLTKFILTNWDWEGSMWRVPAAGEIINALEKHADSLETLCLRFGQRPDDKHVHIRSLAHFTALQNLWIRATEFRHVPAPSSATEPAAMDAIVTVEPDLSGTDCSVFMTLPRGLKRLHLASSAVCVGRDLELIHRRLRDGDSSVRLPDDFRLDGRHASTQYYIAKFRELGLIVGDEVDKLPDSW